MRIIDLSLALGEHFRWQRSPLIPVQSRQLGDVFETSRVELSCHSHTHTDAPIHYVPGGRTIDEMPIGSWTGPATVVDLTHVSANYPVSPADLDKQAGHLRAGDIALLKTCWGNEVDADSREYWQEAPYITDAATDWLVERGARAVGFDFPADRCLREEMNGRRAERHEHTVHAGLLERGVPIIEYLANLSDITTDRVFLVAAPLRLVGADASPVRAFAIEFDEGIPAALEGVS